MRFLEKNLEDIIYDEYDECYERGFHALHSIHRADVGIFLRQPSFPGFGRGDLIAYEFIEEGNVGFFDCTIIECKKDVINTATYGQAKRYVSAVKEYLKKDGVCKVEHLIRYKVVLVGSKVDTRNDFLDIVANDNHCEVYTYGYSSKGIYFEKLDKTTSRKDISVTTSRCLRRAFSAYGVSVLEALLEKSETPLPF